MLCPRTWEAFSGLIRSQLQVRPIRITALGESKYIPNFQILKILALPVPLSQEFCCRVSSRAVQHTSLMFQRSVVRLPEIEPDRTEETSSTSTTHYQTTNHVLTDSSMLSAALFADVATSKNSCTSLHLSVCFTVCGMLLLTVLMTAVSFGKREYLARDIAVISTQSPVASFT